MNHSEATVVSFATSLLALILSACAPPPGPIPPTAPTLMRLQLAGAPVPQATSIIGQSSQYVIATISAPYPADLRVSIDGVELERVVSSLQRERQLSDEGTGFFVVDNVNPTNPGSWVIRISPPPLQQCSLVSFNVAIRDVVSGVESLPLTLSFAQSNSIKFVGTTGRIVALDYPECKAIDQFRLERRTGGAPFALVTPLAAAGGRYVDQKNLTPSTAFDYRLLLVRGPKVVASASPVTATTTALLSGRIEVGAFRQDAMADPFHYQFPSLDPVGKGGVSLAIGAIITRVQNEGDSRVFVTFQDSAGVRVIASPIPAHSSVTAFADMKAAGSWDPIRPEGSAALLPNIWPLTVFWTEP